MDTKKASMFVWAPPYTRLPLQEWDDYSEQCTYYGDQIDSFYKDHAIAWDVFNTEAVHKHSLMSRIRDAEMSIIWMPKSTHDSLQEIVTEVSRIAHREGSVAIFLKQANADSKLEIGLNTITFPRDIGSAADEVRILHDVSRRILHQYRVMRDKPDYRMSMLMRKIALILQDQ